jgi:hypothetical protein
VFVGDAERDRAAALLRNEYVRGRLTVDELAKRTHVVLSARTRGDLHRGLSGLFLFPGLGELVERGRTAVRRALLVLFTGAYLIFSLILALVLALTMLLHGASDLTLAGFLVIWLLPTYLVFRLWHRTAPRRGPRV